MVTATGRPTPLRAVARIWSLVGGGIGAVATFLVTNQVLTANQADTLTDASASGNLLISALNALITAGIAVAAAFGTAKQGEDKVTPVSAPRDNLGSQLVPLASPGTGISSDGV